MFQTLTVIGSPITCDERGCEQPAFVYLRSEDAEGRVAGIAFCCQHWSQARRVHGPVIADDATEAQAEAERIVREGAQ